MTPEEQAAYSRGFADGIAAPRKRWWTPTEVRTLEEWTKSDAELAVKLGRSRMAIRMKRFKINRGDE